MCVEDDHYYVAARGDSVAHCTPCGNTLASTLGALGALIAGVAVVRHLVVGCYRTLPDGRKKELERRFKLYGFGRKLKIAISFYMIACEMGTVYELNLPEAVQRFLESMSVVVTLCINILLRTMPLECAGLSGFTAALRFWFLMPIVVVLVILVIYWPPLDLA